MKRPDIATSYMLGAIGGGLALTGYLGKKGRRQITHHIRDNKVVYGLFALALGGHVADVFGPYDPFDLLGKVFGVTPREIVTEVTEEVLDGMMPKA